MICLFVIVTWIIILKLHCYANKTDYQAEVRVIDCKRLCGQHLKKSLAVRSEQCSCVYTIPLVLSLTQFAALAASLEYV